METIAYPLILTIGGRGSYTLYFRSEDDRDSVRADLTVGVSLYSVTKRIGPAGLAIVPEGAPNEKPVPVGFINPADCENFAADMEAGHLIDMWTTPDQPRTPEPGVHEHQPDFTTLIIAARPDNDQSDTEPVVLAAACVCGMARAWDVSVYSGGGRGWMQSPAHLAKFGLHTPD